MTPGSSESNTRKLGLVLSGGGARGAYQAGVLQGIAEVAALAAMVHALKLACYASISVTIAE